tara:strand:+ start:641 stop:1054 length:414 start_codon:yes stop_codon:yes gene_type:complete
MRLREGHRAELLWRHDEPIAKIAGCLVVVPAWVDRDISPADVASILAGGCHAGYASGTTYHEAQQVMSLHADSEDGVFAFLVSLYGTLPPIPDGTSWSGLASYFLCLAVERWAENVEPELLRSIGNMAELSQMETMS